MSICGDNLRRAGVVAIGRNEGERLRACLASVIGKVPHVVYVDSGSTDESTKLARSMGATVVQLDMSIPFTAARARNAGVARLRELTNDLAFVQVVDGDCIVVDGWLVRAIEAVRADERIAVVCGRRREESPDATMYNRLCDMEWDTPVGESETCGGDALIRLSAFDEVNGYDATIIAGEEPDMCFRMRQRGWRILRIDAEMTLHDARMTNFRQWWKRAVRSGHAVAEAHHRHGRSAERFRANRVRWVLEWAVLIPFIGLALAWWTWGASLAVFGLYLVQWYRLKRWQIDRGAAPSHASLYAQHCIMSKFPELVGMVRYWWNQMLGRRSTIIEYQRA